MILSRPVAARATRIASMVASVPEFTNRIWSSWKREQISSASATVFSVVTAKWIPRSATRRIASTIFGCAWPTTLTPKPPWKSVYSEPSTSQTRESWPRSRYTGYGSPAWKFEATPAGRLLRARSCRAFDPGVRSSRIFVSFSAISAARAFRRSRSATRTTS